MPLASLGQVTTPDPYHELETKHIFGFTEGADIGAEGEKSIEFETTTASGLRCGTYAALEQEVEFDVFRRSILVTSSALMGSASPSTTCPECRTPTGSTSAACRRSSGIW